MVGEFFSVNFFPLRILTLEQKSASGPVHPLRKTGSFTLALEGRIADALVVQKYGSFLERWTLTNIVTFFGRSKISSRYLSIPRSVSSFHKNSHIIYMVEKRNMYIHHCSNWFSPDQQQTAPIFH